MLIDKRSLGESMTRSSGVSSVSDEKISAVRVSGDKGINRIQLDDKRIVNKVSHGKSAIGQVSDNNSVVNQVSVKHGSRVSSQVRSCFIQEDEQELRRLDKDDECLVLVMKGTEVTSESGTEVFSLEEAVDPYSTTVESAVAKELLVKFKDVFPEELPKSLPPREKWIIKIELVEGSSPVSRPTYRMSPVELDELKKQIEEALANGQIQAFEESIRCSSVIREEEGW